MDFDPTELTDDDTKGLDGCEVTIFDDGEAYLQITQGQLAFGVVLTNDERRVLSNQLYLEGDEDTTESETEAALTSGTLTGQYVLSG